MATESGAKNTIDDKQGQERITAMADTKGSLIGPLRKTSKTGIIEKACVPQDCNKDKTPGQRPLRAGITYVLCSKNFQGRLCQKSVMDISASLMLLSSSDHDIWMDDEGMDVKSTSGNVVTKRHKGAETSEFWPVYFAAHLTYPMSNGHYSLCGTLCTADPPTPLVLGVSEP